MKEFIIHVDFKPGIAVRNYWESLGVKEEEVLFVDIETTGLSSKRDAIYQIGLAFSEKEKNNVDSEKKPASWIVLQWLCERRGEEQELLLRFFERLKGYHLLMHFNGTTFDLPFIRQRALKYKNHFPGFGVRRTETEQSEFSEIVQYTPFDDRISVDMFRIFSPLASFLGLPNKKQKSFEAFLGIDREDEMSGGDLIPVYCEYETTGDERLEHYLMIHNHEDMKGMLRLTELFAYRSLREGNFEVESFSLREDRDFSGRIIHELTAKLCLDAPIEKRFVWREDGFYLEAQGTSATAVIRLEEGVMKHFFSNYRDYDYLIKEDMAVYRTVGDLVDPSLRKRATAETCYMKRDGLFLSVGADCATPLFRRTYKSKDVYVLAEETLDLDAVKSAVRKGLG